MLRRLELKRNGRFQNTTLELDKTTVIHGRAESGKSTVFDALVEALTTTSGGTETPVIEADLPFTPTSRAETLGLLACREGELHLGPDATNEPGWADGLDARLRAATIDAAALAEEFDRKASDDPALPHNQERQRLDQQRQQLCDELENLRAAHAELVTLSRRRAELHEEQERLRTAQRQREEQRLALRRELNARREHEADLAELAQITPLSAEEIAELSSLHAEVTSHEEKLNTIEARAADSAARARHLADQLAADRAREPAARQAAGKAAVLGLRFEQFLARPPRREVRRWRPATLVLSLALWTTAIVSINQLGWLVELTALPLAPALPYLGLALGALLGTWGLSRSRPVVLERDLAAHQRLLAQLSEEWHAANLPAWPAGTDDQLRAFFAEQVRVYEQLRRDLDLHAAQKARVEEELGLILERSRGMLEQTLAVRRDAEQAWLALRQLAGYDQATALAAQRARLERRCRDRAGTWSFALETDARTAQLADLTAQLEQLEREEPDSPANAEGSTTAAAERERIVNRGQQLQNELDLLAAHEAELTRAVGHAFSELPHREQELTARATELDEQIAQLEVERQTAAAAAILFAELAKKADLHLELLAQEVTELLRLAGLPEIEVTLTGLDETAISATDAQGTPRPLRQLSASRRDLVVLATRLCLADKLVDEQGSRLIVLEEPFLRLRDNWLACGVRLLHLFQTRRDWQIVLFTRDREVVAMMGELHPALALLDLDRLGAATTRAA